MSNKITFRADPSLIPKLNSIPERERSTVIRQALRRYFAEKELTKGVILDEGESSRRNTGRNQVNLDSPER